VLTRGLGGYRHRVVSRLAGLVDQEVRECDQFLVPGYITNTVSGRGRDKRTAAARVLRATCEPSPAVQVVVA
jgi:hypothetical protein